MNKMNRRRFLKFTATGATTAFVSLGGCQRQATHNKTGLDKKPNIIYILADDLGYGDLGCYGQKMIKTPNIDTMAAQGMRFTQHYSGSTVCALKMSL
jgi:hypothetical protein